MKNIDYLELFFKKHNLPGKVTIKYSSPSVIDEYMSHITLENGDVIHINDIIFDIESKLPEDIIEQWLEKKREQPELTLQDWMQTDIHYIPKDIDVSSVKEYQEEMNEIVNTVKESINQLFDIPIDDGDSEDDSDFNEETEKSEDE